MATTKRHKRLDPLQTAKLWIEKEEDPPGFRISHFGIKGRGIVTKVERWQGDFLLVYKGETISAEEGERREEEDGGSDFRFFFKDLCIDATVESGYLCRLVNHGGKHERNAVMKEINGNLCLFTSRFIKPGEEILYDYGVKNLPWEKKTCKTQVGIERKGDPGLFINFEEKEIKDRRISTEDKQSENYGLEALEAAYKTQHTPCDLNISSRDKNTTTNEDKDGHTEKGQNDKMGPDLKIQGLDVNMATASCTAMDVEISNVYEDQQLNVQGLEINPGKAIDTMNSNEVFAHANINNKEKIKNDNEDQDLEVQVDKVSNTAMNIEIDNVDNRTGDTEKDLKHWNRKKYIISNEVLTHTDINNNKEKRKNDYEDQDLEVLRGEVIVVAMDIENNDADNKTGGTENDLEDWNRENNMTSNEVITHADINSDTEEQQYDEGQVLVIQGPEIDEVNANDIAVDIEINNFGNSTGNTYNDSEPSYREIDSATNEVYTDESEDIYTAQLLNAKEEQVFKIQGPEMDAGKVKDTLIDIAIVDIGNRISDSKSVSGFDIDHECDLFNSKEKVELTNSDFENMSCTDIQEKHFIEMDKEADIEIQRWIRCRESKRQDQRVEIIDEEVINQNAEGQYYQRDVTGLEDHKNVTDIEVHVIKNIDGPELHNVKEGSDSFSEQANIGSISNKISLLQNTGKWGAVAIVKGGEEIGVYPMETDLLSIGSAETDDIRVKTAVKHEALIEVNQQGEIFLVNSSTQKVERLSDNTIFEVGGRALKWKAKTGTCQQDEKVELVVLRENNAFKLAGYGEQQQSNMITDSKMHGFVPNSDSEAESDVVPYPKLSSIVVTNADSTTSSMSEEKQRKKVISVRNKEDRAGKVDYSKRHACIFCGQLDLKIARHLCSKKHENEELIARLPPVSKPGSELQKRREKTLNALRNEGDFIYNIDILKSGSKNQSGIIVAKRPSEGSHNAEDYLPCRYCLRFYVQTELWRHSVNCSFRQDPIVNESNKSDEKESSRFIKSGRMLLHGAGVHLHSGETSWEDDEFYTYVLGALQNDTIGRSLKRDSGLILYGKTEFERLGRRRANEVRYRMRLLERIKTVVKSLHESDSSFDMESLLTPDRFPSFIQAVRTVVGISEERSLNGVMMFDKPELARKVGQMIRKFAEMCEGRSVVNGNREARQSVTDFLFLYTSQWKSKIGSIAHQTSAEKKFNRKTALPLTEDLKKMQQHLDKEIVERGNKLQKFPCSQTWKEFAKVLLTKLTLFNFRRGNECAAMQVAKFQQRNDWKLDNQEIYQSLQRFEQELAQRMDLVEVMGKRNRKVPVLLTQPMKAGIERLIQFRDICGVHPENIYVFAKGQKSFIEGSDALRCVLEQVQDLKRPELLRFPSMRKYLATVIQVFAMPENEVQEVARHMGHELSVHKQFYRLQDDVIELAKIAKLLLAVESGKAHQFKGISMDDLDFDDIPEVGEEEEEIVEKPMECDTDQLPAEHADIPEVGEEEEEIVEKPMECDTDQLPAEHADCESGRNTKIPGDRVDLRKQPVRLKSARLYNDNYEFDDSDRDPDYNDGPTDSSDSDGEPVAKRKKTDKRKWTIEEKDALKPLVLKSYREKKPPTKANIIEHVNKISVLKEMKVSWLSVKYQVWSMAQQLNKRAKKSF